MKISITEFVSRLAHTRDHFCVLFFTQSVRYVVSCRECPFYGTQCHGGWSTSTALYEKYYVIVALEKV